MGIERKCASRTEPHRLKNQHAANQKRTANHPENHLQKRKREEKKQRENEHKTSEILNEINITL